MRAILGGKREGGTMSSNSIRIGGGGGEGVSTTREMRKNGPLFLMKKSQTSFRGEGRRKMPSFYSRENNRDRK